MKCSRLSVLQALSHALENHRACALVTLISCEGSSPRPVGSQMLVLDSGECIGVISSGCIEASIAEQALAAMASGRSRSLRYGVGSPWMDLQLPCGAGIDVNICVQHDRQLLSRTLDTLSARRAVRWTLDTDSQNWRAFDISDNRREFKLSYEPEWQFLVIGRGPAVYSLAAIASQCDMAVSCYSPDESVLVAAQPYCDSTHHLSSPQGFDCPDLDRWSGAATMFHEHEWEPFVLRALLRTDASYIAALGSSRSHALRELVLAEMGVPAKQINRIYGPAGVSIDAQTPAEIALSIVAQMVKVLRRQKPSISLISESFDWQAKAKCVDSFDRV